MGRIKSNYYHSKGAKKNVISQMLDLWKTDVNWYKHTEKDKEICICFSLSLSSLIVFGHSWLAIPALIGMIVSIAYMNDLDVEE